VSSIAERVNAGAAWLDEHEPGWVDRINRDRLDLEDCNRCVGGQLAGWYHYFLQRHDLTDDTAVRLGFDHPLGISGDFDPLTAAWRELIATRHATPGGAP
jgi:hypothetical protein